MKRLFQRMANMTIRAKIFLVFLISLLVHIALVTTSTLQVLDQSARYQLRQGARQSSDLLVSNIRTTLDNATYISYNLLQNTDIIRWLGDGGGMDNTAATRTANQVLTRTHATFPGIESIYLFNNDGESIRASRARMITRFRNPKEAPWYPRAVERKGGFLVSLNAGGALFSSQGSNNISLIRQVLDFNTMTPIGFLIVSLSESFLSEMIGNISEEDKADEGNRTDFFILDETGANLMSGREIPSWNAEVPTDGAVRNVDGETLFLYKTDIPELGWTVLYSTQYRTLKALPYATWMIFMPVLFSVGMYLLGSIFTANLISKPVQGLISAMQGVRNGRFDPMPLGQRRDEFGLLGETYNIMIGALNTTMQQRILLEKEKQRYELDILTEQFKPHFLYNTLDSISYLVLSGDKQRAYEAIVTLSRFYRANLHKGSESIPLNHEAAMIQNYLALQKMRYGETLAFQCDIDPDVEDVPILRNILQPLVENCIYHGIKPSGEAGWITVRAWAGETCTYILVQDDGLGMTPQTLAGLRVHAANHEPLSFGLRGTIRRLSLYYGTDDICEITSAPGDGVSVLLKIPKQGEGEGDTSHGE